MRKRKGRGNMEDAESCALNFFLYKKHGSVLVIIICAWNRIAQLYKNLNIMRGFINPQSRPTS